MIGMVVIFVGDRDGQGVESRTQRRHPGNRSAYLRPGPEFTDRGGHVPHDGPGGHALARPHRTLLASDACGSRTPEPSRA